MIRTDIVFSNGWGKLLSTPEPFVTCRFALAIESSYIAIFDARNLILTAIFFDKRPNRLATGHFARKAYIFTLISAITGR
jgi:hypothetical protein